MLNQLHPPLFLFNSLCHMESLLGMTEEPVCHSEKNVLLFKMYHQYINIYKYVYYIYEHIFLYRIPWACATVLLNYDRQEVWVCQLLYCMLRSH